MTSAGVVKRHSLFAPLRSGNWGFLASGSSPHRNVHATGGRRKEKRKKKLANRLQRRKRNRARAYLVLNLLTYRERHFLDKDAANPVQFHRLTPIIESACDEHLVRIVRPTHQCEKPTSQRSNSLCLCHGMSRALPVRQIWPPLSCAEKSRPPSPGRMPRAGRGGGRWNSPLECKSPHFC